MTLVIRYFTDKSHVLTFLIIVYILIIDRFINPFSFSFSFLFFRFHVHSLHKVPQYSNLVIGVNVEVKLVLMTTNYMIQVVVKTFLRYTHPVGSLIQCHTISLVQLTPFLHPINDQSYLSLFWATSSCLLLSFWRL